MNVLLILIPVSLILGALGLCAFLWTLRNGQYEDSAGAAARLLLDDADPRADPADGDGADRSERPHRS